MTTDSKDDDEAAVKPQVIDLEAEDVTHAAEPDEVAKETPTPPTPRQNNPRNTSRWIAAALLAGAIAGGWLYRDVLSSYLPTDEMTSLKARIDTLEANAKISAGQLVAVSAAADHANQAAQAADASSKEIASSVAATASGVSGLSARVGKAEIALQSARSDLDALRSAVASGGTAGSSNVDPAALAAIGQRLDTLEKDVASLKGGAGATDQSASLAALSQALSDVRAKIAAGTSYRDELDRIARMVPAAAGLDILEAHASAGLPAAKGLAAELRAAIPALPKPKTSTPAESSGYLDSFWNAVTSIVTIRTIGEADWPAIAEQCASFADTGDLTQAIARIDASEGAVPSALGQWRDRAAARLKLEAALAEVSDAVQRQIVSLGAGQ
jgi:hypothetical protein